MYNQIIVVYPTIPLMPSEVHSIFEKKMVWETMENVRYVGFQDVFDEIENWSKPKLIIHFFYSLFNRLFLQELMLIIIARKKVFKKIPVLLKFYLKALTFSKRMDINPKDKVLIYTFWCDFPVLSGIFLKDKLVSARVITRVHGYDLYHEVHPYSYFPFRKLFVKEVNMFFPVSEFGQNYLVNRWKVKTEKINFSPLGIFTDPSCIIDATSIKELVSCSAVTEVKRVGLIIDALSFAPNDLSLKWVHFGDGPLLNHLKRKAQNLPKNIKVEFMGNRSNDEILAYYKKDPNKLFISVSSSEGIPFSIMEAMAYGIPVLATDVGGVSELLTERTGVLLQSNVSPKELFHEIENYLSKEQKTIMGFSRASKVSIQEKFNAHENFNKFKQLIFLAQKRD